MAIEHSVITDPEIHEPKGASSAAGGYVLVANGDGTTSWFDPSQVVDPSDLQDAALMVAQSFGEQTFPAVDTPIQVAFGAGQQGPADPVMISGLGVLTFNVTGTYRIVVELQFGLTEASVQDDALFHFRAKVNGTQIDKTTTQRTAGKNADVHNYTIWRNFVAGDELTYEVVLDAGNGNEGSLKTFNPSTAGWPDSPSAAIEVHQLQKTTV